MLPQQIERTGRKNQKGETEILIPKPPKKNISRYQATKTQKVTLQTDIHRAGYWTPQTRPQIKSQLYKGIVGDNINIMLAVAAFNFKRIMNKLKSSFWQFFEMLFSTLSKSYLECFILKLTF